MTKRITICRKRDIAAAGQFYDEVTRYLDSTINYPKWRQGSYPSESSVSEAYDKGTQYLCVDNGRIKGAFVLNDDPQGDYASAKWSRYLPEGQYAVLHAFAVHPDFMHGDTAAFMLQWAKERAKKSGAKGIRLDVVPTNYPARRFYEKHGFAFVEERDLGRNFDDIPTFCLYEYYFDK